MENSKPNTITPKIIPLARKKLLAQALFKDSPMKCLIKGYRPGKRSAHSSMTNFENINFVPGYKSVIVSPLKEKNVSCHKKKITNNTHKECINTLSRSSSKSIPKLSPSPDRKVQFLLESRFNKRIIDTLTQLLIEKMDKDPDYLLEIKEKDPNKYASFKEEHIEIHKDSWMQESIKTLETSEMLKINNETDAKVIDVKKEAFFSYVCNSTLLKSVTDKAKSISLNFR
jgi:hypothetical protein